jgi:hypothetical protein
VLILIQINDDKRRTTKTNLIDFSSIFSKTLNTTVRRQQRVRCCEIESDIHLKMWIMNVGQLTLRVFCRLYVCLPAQLLHSPILPRHVVVVHKDVHLSTLIVHHLRIIERKLLSQLMSMSKRMIHKLSR